MVKIGDRVRCVDNRDNEEFYSVGAEGVVTSIDFDGDLWVAFDRGSYDQDFGCRKAWCGTPSSFELVTNHDIQTIQTIADELRLTPVRKLTKARLVELGEMLEAACTRIEDAKR